VAYTALTVIDWGLPMIHLGQLVPAKPWSNSWPNRSMVGPYEPSCGLASAPTKSFAGFMTEREWRAVRNYLEDGEGLLQQAVALDPPLASAYRSPTYLAGVGASDYQLAYLRSCRSTLSYFARRELREVEAQVLRTEADRARALAEDPVAPLMLKAYVPGSMRWDDECSFLLHVPDFSADMLFETMYQGWFWMSLLQSTDKCLRDARSALYPESQANERGELIAAIDHHLAG